MDARELISKIDSQESYNNLIDILTSAVRMMMENKEFPSCMTDLSKEVTHTTKLVCRTLIIECCSHEKMTHNDTIPIFISKYSFKYKSSCAKYKSSYAKDQIIDMDSAFLYIADDVVHNINKQLVFELIAGMSEVK